MTQKSIKWVLLIFILLLVVSLFGLNQPIFDDESNYVQLMNTPVSSLTFNLVSTHPHPPFGGWVFYIVGNLFGSEVWIYRLVSVFFGMINLLLVYLIVRREYSLKAAFFSLILMGFSFYHVLMSLQIDVEGSMLVTTFLLMVFFYLKYVKTKDKKNLFYTGMAFGLALLTKYNVLILLPAIGLYGLINTESKQIFCYSNIKKNIFNMFVIVSIGLSVFSLFPIFHFESFLRTFGHSSNYFGLNFSLMAVSMLLFWATPLLLGLFLFQMFKFEKKDSLWMLWFFFIFIIYTFLIIGRPGDHGAIGGVADYSRHFMNLVVPFSVLGGVFLSRIKINWKQLVGGVVIGVIALVSFFIINLNTLRVLPRDFSVYLEALTSFDFNFLFSFTTSSGNLLGVNMGIMVFGILFGFLLAAFYLLFTYLRRYKIRKWVLVLFIATGAALNIFLVAEYLGPVTSPDVNNVFYEMVDYVKENQVKYPLYVNDEGLLLHINELRFQQKEGQFNLGRYFESLDSHEPLQGTILILNWPPLSKENLIWDVVKSCHLKKRFYSREILVGEIYNCLK